jgi:MFS family permease
VVALSISETISWGILYYAYAVFLAPSARALGASSTTVSGALTVALLVSGAVGVLVGRHLDRHGPRALMTAGSIAGVALTVAWSQADSVLALYAIWTGIGVVMAAVLYEPAFVVLAKTFPDATERRRAMTAMTLVAALASFIFVPLAQALLEDHGWRDAVLILAAVLTVTIPLHALLLDGVAPSRPRAAPGRRRGAVRAVLRRRDFRRLTAAYVLASIAGVAILVEAIPMLEARGYSPAFAAFAVGTIGVSQIPGRLVFSFAGRWIPEAALTPLTFALVAIGLLVLVLSWTAPVVLAGMVLLGMGNGMATLSRAAGMVERFGAQDYGAIASVTATGTTVARAVAPLIATSLAALVGVDALIAVLIGCAALATATSLTVRAPATHASAPVRIATATEHAPANID